METRPQRTDSAGGGAEDAPGRRERAESRPRRGQDPSGGTILVVDDNEDCRLALRTLLESQGYGVHEAGDGEDAVEAARRHQPDLILMDIMMPGVDGLEATRRIRDDGRVNGTRIVAISAMEGAREASLSAGCDECVLKPVDLKELGRLVEGWMEAG